MELWNFWWSVISLLRPAFLRLRTFIWFACVVCGFCVRTDLMGVTSFIRCLDLQPECYDRILDMFHCRGLDYRKLRKLRVKAVLHFTTGVLWKVNGRIVVLGDGVKNPKSGKKMPASRNSIRNRSQIQSRNTYSVIACRPSALSQRRANG